MKNFRFWLLVLVVWWVAAFMTPDASAGTIGTCHNTSRSFHIAQPADGALLSGTYQIRTDSYCDRVPSASRGKRSEDGASTCTGITTWHILGDMDNFYTDPDNFTRFNAYQYYNFNTTIASNLLGDGRDYCIKVFARGTDAFTSDFMIDNLAPTLTNVHIASNNSISGSATIGDRITVSFTGSEALTGVSMLIGGLTGNVTNTSGNRRQGYVTGTTAIASGNVSIAITVQDLVGRTTTVTGTTDSSNISYTKTIPYLTSVHISSSNARTGYAKAGDTITLTFTGNVPLTGIIMTLANTAVMPTGGVARVTLLSGRSDGPIPFVILFQSLQGLAGTGVDSTTTDGSSVIYDNTPPVITNAGSLTTGDNRVNYTFTTNEQTNLLYGNFGSGFVVSNLFVLSWTNTISVSSLAAGTRNSAQIVPLDVAGNVGNIMYLPSFTVADINSTLSPTINTNGGGGGYHGTFVPRTVVATPTKAIHTITTTVLQKIQVILKPSVYQKLLDLLIAKKMISL